MKIDEVNIYYKLKLTYGEQKGKIVEYIIDIDDLQEDDISDKLIEDGHYDSMGWPTDYYEVIERRLQ